MKTITGKLKSLLLLNFFFLAMFGPVTGQNIPDRPTPPRLVVDYTGTLTASEINALEHKLVSFNDTTSNQILIVITDELYGNEIEEFATGIGHKWGVGQKDLDNGVVIVLKPKTVQNQGQAFISVGYGLEGAITDITAGHIYDYEMVPYFKQNNYYAGLDAATNVLMALAAGEYSSDEYNKGKGGGLWAIAPFIFFVFIFILISRMSRRSRTIGSSSMSPWTAFWLGSMMGGSSGRSWGGGSSGGGFSGGGGGFGGFGGGGFGGGGAGGSW